jgi:hypothetical protein
MSLVYRHRPDNLALQLTDVLRGQPPGNPEVALRVTSGGDRVRRDVFVTPTFGPARPGRLVIARDTPLAVTLTGTDLRFHVRRELLLTLELRAGPAAALRLHCAGLRAAAYSYRLRWPGQQKVALTRLNPETDGQTSLDISVRKGMLVPSPGLLRDTDGLVIYGNLSLHPATDGELTLEMSGARMEWDFVHGVLSAVRVFDRGGKIASLWVLDVTSSVVAQTATLVETPGNSDRTPRERIGIKEAI